MEASERNNVIMSGISKLMNKSFLQRTISGILLVIVALVTIIMGKDVLFATVSIISLIGVFELYRVFGIEKKLPGIVGYIGTAAYLIFLRSGLSEYFMPLFIVILMLLMAVYVFSFPKYKAEIIMAAYFGLFYVTIMLTCIYRVRMLKSGVYLVWLIFLCSWGCDTCAYLVGVMFGKHKMAPVLSPKKSVEGGIGGILGAALLGFIYARIFGTYMTELSNPMVTVPIICGIAAVISQIGDLAASGIKRNHEIKDYGKLIPGHGGILDRFDSVIFTAPVIYYLVMYL